MWVSVTRPVSKLGLGVVPVSFYGIRYELPQRQRNDTGNDGRYEVKNGVKIDIYLIPNWYTIIDPGKNFVGSIQI